MTSLVMAAILVFGVASYRMLTVSDLPAVDYPTINVNATLPGASPETMAATVATPLEKAFTAIAGIDNITSSSSLGTTSITLQFSPDRDIDAAAQDVNAAISGALAFLPSNIIPPSYRKQNPAASPILFFALTSNAMSLTALDEVAETTISQRLSQVEGVSQVNVFGSAKYAVRIRLDPAQLTTRGLSVNDVAAAVCRHNMLLAALVFVVLVIFVFLRNVTATVIPSLTLPMAIVGTFSVMYVLNFSIDNLSLMALTLAVGFVVDDAIVMLENVVRHIEQGQPPLDAPLDGAEEVSFAILSIALSS